jgi:alpha-ribazole phosphatase
VVIALFRHGLTEENKRKAYLGWNDSPLCSESQNSATTSTYECYFSSDLKRCIHTANLLFPKEKCILLKDLREMNFGKWQGKTFEDLKDDNLYQQWIDAPLRTCPPDGESFQQFSDRVLSGWGRITQEVCTGAFSVVP